MKWQSDKGTEAQRQKAEGKIKINVEYRMTNVARSPCTTENEKDEKDEKECIMRLLKEL